jgi:hypothetical protein
VKNLIALQSRTIYDLSEHLRQKDTLKQEVVLCAESEARWSPKSSMLSPKEIFGPFIHEGHQFHE